MRKDRKGKTENGRRGAENGKATVSGILVAQNRRISLMPRPDATHK